METRDFDDYQEYISKRANKLDKYENFVRERLQDCNQASAAQVHDWLKENYSDFTPVSEKTVYNFVLRIREKYNLLKEFESREFCKVPELPYGQQAQVDFGEYILYDNEKQRKKVYFFSLVLARSRFKFVYFSLCPFTTAITIEAHEKAFEFIGGYPKTLVYDQDKVLLYSENVGDLILTEEFRSYHASRPFGLHFCRKSDPQSKGKIENVIKYIKYNFLRGRVYFNIHQLSGESIGWLDRTANGKKHATTMLVPALEWQIEKAHLKPLRETFLVPEKISSYIVRKDNTVSFKGNFYTVPVGTFQPPETKVILKQENEDLIIQNTDKEEIARHKISLIKGKLVFNRNHYRDTSKSLDEFRIQVAENFSDELQAANYLEHLRIEYPRYFRDQARMIHAVCQKYSRQQCDEALKYCIENNIFKGTDFEPVLLSLTEQTPVDPTKKNEETGLLKNQKYQIYPQTSHISDYNKILK